MSIAVCNRKSILQEPENHHSLSSFIPFPSLNLPSGNQITSIESQNLTNTRIYVDFVNPHITSTTPRWFEFDIALSDDVDTVYFGAFDFGIVYPTAIFGQHVVDSNHVSVSLTGNFSNKPYNLQLIDSSSSMFILRIKRDPIPITGGDSLVNLSINPSPAIHVAIQIKDCNNAGIISEVGTHPHYPNRGYCLVPQPTTDTIYNYTNPDLSSPLFFASCDFHIDRISPLRVNGGTGDIVTIEGLNFDTSRGAGNVFLRNANNSYSYLPLDSIDYLTWNDTLIRFVMPGNIDNSTFFSDNQFGVAGSGAIIIKKNATDSIQIDSITVGYSVRTYFNPYSNAKKLFNLTDDRTTYSGGYNFRTDTSFSNLFWG